MYGNPKVVAVKDSSNRQLIAPRENKEMAIESGNGKLDSDDVRRMFLEGMGSSGNLQVLSVHSCSSPSLQTRLELFEKEIEITEAYRGIANVQYAWLASSEQDITEIIMYGLGHCGTSVMKSAYGVRVDLTSTSCAHASASYCEVGRNGGRHMILCQVVLGSLEVIQRGSRQLHPGSLGYDTGVDNLQNPRHYTVWNTNMNTHIYPEYVAIFKMTSNNVIEGGYLARSEVTMLLQGRLCRPFQESRASYK